MMLIQLQKVISILLLYWYHFYHIVSTYYNTKYMRELKQAELPSKNWLL